MGQGYNSIERNMCVFVCVKWLQICREVVVVWWSWLRQSIADDFTTLGHW